MSRVIVSFLLLVGSVAAQFDPGAIIRRVRVRVNYTNGACGVSTHVRLQGRNGPMLEGIANEHCIVDFASVPAGTYHLIVSAQDLPDSDAGTVVMDSTTTPEFEVKVQRASDPQKTVGLPVSPFVSTADLGVPSHARKEFDKANELMGRQDFPKAIQSLNKAIAIYPSYADAYNNLGVIYARLGDRDREREVLQKAISINDHFAPAYVNEARMDIATGDFPDAETALNKASSFDPTDAMTLVLLTYAEFMDHRFDDTIATSRRAHTLPGEHAFAHQVAARAFEQKRDAANAIAELKLFLKEEPTGERADKARKELAAVQRIPH